MYITKADIIVCLDLIAYAFIRRTKKLKRDKYLLTEGPTSKDEQHERLADSENAMIFA